MKDSDKITQLNASNNICHHCSALHLCLVNVLNTSEKNKFSNVTVRNERLRRDQHLFLSNDPLCYIYIIHSGSFKTYIENSNGDIQIIAFHFQGDILGLNGIVDDVQTCSAVALENANVCKIPLAEFEAMIIQYPALSHIFKNRLSREIILNQRMLFVLGVMNKEQKIADFFIRMSIENELRGYSPVELILSMRRLDIAHHLGIAYETVSRILRDFQDKGIISVKGRNISIVDLEALKSLLQCNDTEDNIKAAAISQK